MSGAAASPGAAGGRFIVLEGGEASGKSTQAARLAERLGALLTREPGGTPLGERIRSLLLDPAPSPDPSAPGGAGGLAPRTEALLLLAARAEHVAAVIRPALEAGADVVCDRFAGSTLAYQGWGRGLPVAELRSLSEWAAAGCEPDLVVLLQVPPEVGAARLAARGRAADRMEGAGASFFERVEEGFAALAAADPDRWAVVDGDGTVDAVADRVAAAVAERLAARAPGVT
ncbi:dTMP kinase [Acidimicrobiaceae bacterium USS-CC1]|uniref:Thymidylate kinase n=1 Tax=Acidiferrimicrobium australe TaxID=2664430 RepID=A0ABW9QSP8_9ACTN|nr:dTMP kinase [Acidiferrimicrobium australe]